MSDKDEEIQSLYDEFQKRLEALKKDKPSEEDQAQKEEKLEKQLRYALDKMKGAAAFIIVGIDKKSNDNLVPFAFGHSTTPEAEIMASAHMAYLVQRAHHELAMSALAKLNQEDA